MLAYHTGSVMRYLLETLYTVRYDPGYIHNSDTCSNK